MCRYIDTYMYTSARLYESCKKLRAGPPEMPLQNWYNCGKKHFHLTMMAGWK